MKPNIKWISILTTIALSLIATGLDVMPEMWSLRFWFYLLGIVTLGMVAQAIYDKRERKTA